MNERARRKPTPWLKPLVAILVLVPLGWLVFRLLTDRLGANPIEAALNDLGWWTLVTLLASLACTPIKLLVGWNWPLRIRRLLGLGAFGYGSLHLAVYLGPDQLFAWGDIIEDLFKRKFITVGFVAWLLMVPLAVTSTTKMVKRMGYARWKLLHRLAYVSAVLGVVHFAWRVKADLTEPLLYGAVLALLLGVRVVAFLRGRSDRGGATSSPSA